jgi:hypothetical protein
MIIRSWTTTKKDTTRGVPGTAASRSFVLTEDSDRFLGWSLERPGNDPFQVGHEPVRRVAGPLGPPIEHLPRCLTCEHEILGKDCVQKTVPADQGSALYKEPRLLEQLKHDHIPAVSECFSGGDNLRYRSAGVPPIAG